MAAPVGEPSALAPATLAPAADEESSASEDEPSKKKQTVSPANGGNPAPAVGGSQVEVHSPAPKEGEPKNDVHS